MGGALFRKVNFEPSKCSACCLLLAVLRAEAAFLLLKVCFLLLKSAQFCIQRFRILDVLRDVLARLIDAGGKCLKVFIQFLFLFSSDLLPLLDGIVLVLRSRHEKEILDSFQFLIRRDDIHVRELTRHLKEDAALLVGLHRVGKVAENHQHLDTLKVNPADGFKYLRILLLLGLHAVHVVVRDVARELLSG